MSVKLWKNVQVAVQSVKGSPKTITAITKANPGVASATAHGFDDGDYVLLAALGMSQINDKVVRVDDKATDSFSLEGVDTTLFDTFSSGSASEITFGVSMTTALTVNASGGDFDFVDKTTIHDNVKSQIPGLPSAATFTMDNIWDPADPALLAFKAASDAQQELAIKISWPDGGKIIFTGYIGCSMLPGGSAQEKVTTPVVITMNGKPTVYSN